MPLREQLWPVALERDNARPFSCGQEPMRGCLQCRSRVCRCRAGKLAAKPAAEAERERNKIPLQEIGTPLVGQRAGTGRSSKAFSWAGSACAGASQLGGAECERSVSRSAY